MRTENSKSMIPVTGKNITAFLAAVMLSAALSACNAHYNQAVFLEQEQRWEESAIQYHLAQVEDPYDRTILEALARVNRKVARENFERYKEYLTKKEFRKAYQRLMDAARQDPQFDSVKKEAAKWTRVLVGGQIKLDFRLVQGNVALADELGLSVRLNTPNPGVTLDAEVDLDTGAFFVEDLLYDRAEEMFAYYSLHAIGVKLVRGRSRIQQFTTTEFQRFINFRSPVLEEVSGKLTIKQGQGLKTVINHRKQLKEKTPGTEIVSSPDRRYRLNINGNKIFVAAEKGWSDFTPRFLYVNGKDRRLFVDFGRYELSQPEQGKNWRIRRLPMGGGQDYFPELARNVTLQPYFYYREGVYVFLPARKG